jgi:transketolase
MSEELDQLCINTIRLLAVDMVEKAKSGHPGLPLGAGAMAYVLWAKAMRHNPKNPHWPNRDRFVLSAGHGSALLYALLHMTGYDLTLDDLKNFRQWESHTPGHPEYGMTPGVETTTGPLGQGIATAVGMAIAERYLAEVFNQAGFPIVDHRTYVLCGDGDLMEGIASEAASIAGHLKLAKLICLYDDNKISIEGSTDLAFTEDVRRRFLSYGWRVIEVEGNDIAGVTASLKKAKAEKERPTLIKAHTHIGFGCPKKQDTSSAHGEPLGADELSAVKKCFGFLPERTFFVPEQATAHCALVTQRGAKAEAQWQRLFVKYAKAYPDKAELYQQSLRGELPNGWQQALPSFAASEAQATRQASGKVLNALAAAIPQLIGGSADLAPSNNTLIKGAADFSAQTPGGRNLRFGVREHAMGAIVNGMALSGQLRPYGATFLVFADYLRPSIRLAALMQVPSLFVFTHDSIGLGEDGPTHQPIEHLAALRVIPHLTVLRPADANETAAAWRIILERRRPAVLVLSRQKLPVLDPTACPALTGVEKGAYVLTDCDQPQLILIATGSEVHLALAAANRIKEAGLRVRVVSMPSWELFAEQSQEYRNQVLPPSVKARLAIEAASPLGWHRWVGDNGDVIAIERFGASAPGEVLMSHFGFTIDNVVARAQMLMQKTV